MTAEKVRIDRLRRVAARRGYVLRKVRRMDPKATDFGLFTLEGRGRRVIGTLDEIERALDE